ncbi:hypothetical protein LTR95_018837 [Oleoguttula sp. CCFEE 5521]
MVRKKLEVKDGNIKLSPRQLDLLRVYALNISSTVSASTKQESESDIAVLIQLQIDWDDVATKVGFSTKKVARDTWLTVKKKLGSVKKGGEDEGEGEEAVQSIEEHDEAEVKKDKGSKKRKSGVTNDEVTAPKKKAKITTKRELSVEVEQADEEAEGDVILDNGAVSDISHTDVEDAPESPVMGAETTEDIERESAKTWEVTNEHAEDEKLSEQEALDAQLLFGL